ncbi:hypothetical protein IG631_00200 [Alternaria alternata]|nr:hypothetical protein IG631_00200 [Alternaria alternata]
MDRGTCISYPVAKVKCTSSLTHLCRLFTHSENTLFPCSPFTLTTVQHAASSIMVLVQVPFALAHTIASNHWTKIKGFQHLSALLPRLVTVATSPSLAYVFRDTVATPPTTSAPTHTILQFNA